jgi:hypothetical protein
MIFEKLGNTRRRSHRSRFGILVALVALFGALSVPASAMPVQVFVSETNVGGGNFRYDYTVLNTGALGPGFNIFDFFIDYLGGDVLNVVVPTGWDSNPTNPVPSGTSFVDSFSLSTSFDILAGNALGVFKYTLDHRVGSVPFSVLFTNPHEPNDRLQVYGETSNDPPPPVAAVPEPATVVLLGVSLAGLLSRRQFQSSRRKVQQPS